jgi:hypothetical protein
LFFLQYVFGRFSARGVQKHQKNVFAKSPCRKTIPKQIDKNFDVRNASFSSIFYFLVLSRFREFFFDGSKKKTQQQNKLQKKRAERPLQKIGQGNRRAEEVNGWKYSFLAASFLCA